MRHAEPGLGRRAARGRHRVPRPRPRRRSSDEDDPEIVERGRRDAARPGRPRPRPRPARSPAAHRARLGRPPALPVLRRPARPDGAHLPARERLQALTEPAVGSTEVEPRPAGARRPRRARARGSSPTPRTSRCSSRARRDGADRCDLQAGPGRATAVGLPRRTLAGREVAAYVVVARPAAGTSCPPTVLRDGPLGPGSVQRWIGDPYDARRTTDVVVDLVPEGGRAGLAGGARRRGHRAGRSCVVHADAATCRGVAVLDAVINNADRKGSHLRAGRRRAPVGLRPRRELPPRSPSCAPCCGAGRASRCPTTTWRGSTRLRDALGDRRRQPRRRPCERC